MTVDLTQLITAEARHDAEKALALIAQQATALACLTETDWYVTRKVETGKEIPKDILAARGAARADLGGGRTGR